MSYTSLLIDSCTTQRFTEGAADDYGVPVRTWADELTDIACRLVSAKGRELKVGAEIVVADYKLFVGSVDITEQDRIVIGSNTYEILLVEDYSNGLSSHHKQIWLRISR